MCGIYGIYSKKLIDLSDGVKSLKKTSHRGPDNLGYWVNKEKTLFLGHNRLSIIDVSSISNQPMIDNDTGMVITFNGEIYNYKDIREQLVKLGVKFKSSSDTEVLIKAIAFWGKDALDKFTGMFSFCIYNQIENSVLIARDRAGEKPLYYCFEDGVFQFSSEVRNISLKNREIDFYSLNYYLGAFGIPSGRSIYKGIKELKAGNFLEINLDEIVSEKDLKETEYWNINKLKTNYIFDERSLLDEFDLLLTNSIKGQLQSDVPLGVLLSGGIDSTIVTSKVSELRSNVNTFTVGFENRSQFDESSVAKFISDRFDTKHTQIELSDINIDTFLDIIDSLDQPLGDNSFIPVSLISKTISNKSIKVVLGGDGADEIFGGYRQYGNFVKLKNKFENQPKFLLAMMYKLSLAYPNGLPYSNYFSEFESIIKNEHAMLANSFNSKLRKKLFNDGSNFSEFSDIFRSKYIKDWDYIQNSCLVDFNNYLPNNILTKVDRASMQASLEVRAPFLDSKIIEFGFTKVPTQFKTNGFSNKILLQKYLKEKVQDYPNFNVKKGFVFPINEMMISNKSWEKLFKETIFDINPELFNQKYLQKLWKLNKIGFDHSQKLYSIFVFNRWSLKNNIKI